MRAIIIILAVLLGLHVLGLKVTIDIDRATPIAVEQPAPQEAAHADQDDPATDGESERERNSI